jgi:FtsZ-binding cell division protein ZapB
LLSSSSSVFVVVVETMTPPLASRLGKVEEDFRKMKENVRSLLGRIEALEGEKEDLKKKVECLQERL